MSKVLTDGQQTDNQNFEGYNIIPQHFFVVGHKNQPVLL